MRRVVITGVGVVTSLGLNAPLFWENIVKGRSGIGLIEAFDSTEYPVKIAGEIKNFDPGVFLNKRIAQRVDRFCQFGLVASIEAVKDSGIDLHKDDVNRIGVMVGSGIGGLTEIEIQHTRLVEKGPSKISPFMIPKLMVNAASGQISIYFGLRGPNSSVATACASASNAIGHAFDLIRRGAADAMLSGGTEAAITPLGVGGFIAMNALSRRNDEPTKASRPFDLKRDGFVLGEGAGIVILEELERAKKRGANIYAEMAGYGMSGDGYHIAAPEPCGVGAALAMKQAIEDSGLDISEIRHINAHGTGTPLGDVAETLAIKAVFGAHAKTVLVSSTKSMIGHLLGASGGPELIATIMAIRENIVPPTINLEEPDPKCDLDYVPNTAREAQVNAALSNSFGFGGHNASLVAKKYRGD